MNIKRREFIMLLGGAAAWPIAARAQQAMPVIGFLNSGSPEPPHFIAGFREGLKQSGFVEGQSVTIEYRWARGQFDRLPAMAEELVGHHVSVLVAGSVRATEAAKAATSTIPIVFQMGSDPVRLGIVASFNRPDGNLTGVSQLSRALITKRLELLRELTPQATLFAVLLDPQARTIEEDIVNVQEAARALDLRTLILNQRDLGAAFAAAAEQHAGALLVSANTYWFDHRDQIISLAERYKLPTSYEAREFAADGGLMSYGSDFAAIFRQLGIYAGRILKGEKVAVLPVQQPTKFELVINLKTAKALGLTIPPSILGRADEVIE
jgi:putative ABC transport system substrate-binding protein